MPYTIICPACSVSLPGVPEALVGKSIKCTTCREPVKVEPPVPKPPTPKPPVAQSVPQAQRQPAPIDAEVVSAAPAKRPATPTAAPFPTAQAVPARRPAVTPKPAAKTRPPADDEDDRPSKKGSLRDRDDEERDEDDRPRKGSRRRDDDDPPKKSAMPIVLGVIAAVVVLGGVGALAAVMMSNKPETAKATDTQPAGVSTQPQPPFTPPTQPTPPPTKPDTPPTQPEKPPVDPPPVEPPPPVISPVKRDQMPAEVLTKVKRSTVYIEVDDGLDGGGSGSGWFGGEPGLIVTNAHVLGMLYPGAKEPAKITVFTDSGVKGKQRQFDGQKVKVLAVDRDMDLAVLQIVNEKDLPPPIPLRPASQLVELDKLVCLGFPGGRRLSDRNRSTDPPTVTVTASAVSAFRNDDGGNMYSVQIQGGVVHGNSGGPVTDLDGNVIGVAVRVDIDNRGQMTNIAYAVPSEYVTGLLAGRAAEAVIGQGYYKGDRVVYPITVRCADAMSRLKGVGVGVWVGEKGAGVRTPGDQHVEEKGDSGYKEVALTYDKAKKVATGEIDFPKDAAGRAYWAQAYYTNAHTPKRFLAGKQLPPDSQPVDRVAADLTPRYPVGARFKLTVTHGLKVSERFEKDGVQALDGRVVLQEMKLRETVNKGTANGHAQLEAVMDADGLKIEVLTPEKSPDLTKELRLAQDGVARWGGVLSVGRDGKGASTRYQVGLSAASEPATQALTDRLGAQLSTALYETAIKLPGKQVEAGTTWTDNTLHRFRWHPLTLLADPPGKTAVVGNVKEEVTYTYLGRRERGGKGEVVVRVDGVLRPMTGDAAATCGSVEGQLVLDEKTGMVTDGTLKREFVLEGEVKGVKVRASGTEAVKITREK